MAAVTGELVTRARLTPKQELFCKMYATEKQFFGNGAASYIEAYQPNRLRLGWYGMACASASRLLSNVKVCERINELLEAAGLNDEFVDKQLLFLLTQHKDWNAKLAAIREYNKLKGRVEEKIKLTGQLTLKPVEVLPIRNADQLQAKPSS